MEVTALLARRTIPEQLQYQRMIVSCYLAIREGLIGTNYRKLQILMNP